MLGQNAKYYQRFPDDVEAVQNIVRHLISQPEGGVRTPSGNLLTPRSLQVLGLSGARTKQQVQQSTWMAFCATACGAVAKTRRVSASVWLGPHAHSYASWRMSHHPICSRGVSVIRTCHKHACWSHDTHAFTEVQDIWSPWGMGPSRPFDSRLYLQALGRVVDLSACISCWRRPGMATTSACPS